MLYRSIAFFVILSISSVLYSDRNSGEGRYGGPPTAAATTTHELNWQTYEVGTPAVSFECPWEPMAMENDFPANHERFECQGYESADGMGLMVSSGTLSVGMGSLDLASEAWLQSLRGEDLAVEVAVIREDEIVVSSLRGRRQRGTCTASAQGWSYSFDIVYLVAGRHYWTLMVWSTSLNQDACDTFDRIVDSIDIADYEWELRTYGAEPIIVETPCELEAVRFEKVGIDLNENILESVESFYAFHDDLYVEVVAIRAPDGTEFDPLPGLRQGLQERLDIECLFEVEQQETLRDGIEGMLESGQFELEGEVRAYHHLCFQDGNRVWVICMMNKTDNAYACDTASRIIESVRFVDR